MSASEMKAVVEAELSEQDKALFVNAVAGIDTTVPTAAEEKGAKKSKRMTRAEKEAAGLPVGKKAKFMAPVAAAISEVSQLTVAPIVAPTPSVLDMAFDSIVDDLLGDSKADLERMTQLRDEAMALNAQIKSVNLRDMEYKANRDAAQWEREQILEANRQIFKDLGNRGPASPVLQAAFVELQDAYFKKDGKTDPMKSAKFMDICLKVVLANPRMKQLHEQNVERAFAILWKFEEEKARIDGLRAEMVSKFDEANAIALAHGWPTTKPHEKEVVNSHK